MLRRWGLVLVVLLTVLVIAVNVHYGRAAGLALEVRYEARTDAHVLHLGQVSPCPTLEVVNGRHEAVYRLRFAGQRKLLLAGAPALSFGSLEVTGSDRGDALEWHVPCRYATRLEHDDQDTRLVLRFGWRAVRDSRSSPTAPVGDVGCEQLVDGQSTVVTEHLALTTPGWAVDDALTARVIEDVSGLGRRLAFAVKVPRALTGRLAVVVPRDGLGHGAPLTQLARNARVGLNGGYFDPASQFPLGALRLADEWISPPMLERTCLVLGPRGVSLEGLKWTATVRCGGSTWPLTVFNHRPGPDDARAVTTPRWPGAPTFAGFTRTPLGDGLVLHHRAPLPGEPRLTLSCEPPVVGSVLGAGPRLLRAGRVSVETAGHFRADITESVAARSGVGLTAGGDVWLVNAPARLPACGGWSLNQFGELFRELGCTDAMNLDGGPSATMVAGNHVLGPPLVGEEAKLADALVLNR